MLFSGRTFFLRLFLFLFLSCFFLSFSYAAPKKSRFSASKKIRNKSASKKSVPPKKAVRNIEKIDCGDVHAVAYSPDGKLIAFGGLSKVIYIFDVKNWRLVGTLRGHEGAIGVLRFSPDGKKLASLSADHSVRLWDVAKVRFLRSFSDTDRDIRSLVFVPPDGKSIAVGGGGAWNGGWVNIWDVDTAAKVRTVGEHINMITSLSFSPKGHFLATGSTDQRVKLWSMQNEETKPVVFKHGRAVSSIILSKDGRKIVSAGADNVIRIWDVETGKELTTLYGHTSWVETLALSNDNTLLVSSGLDGSIRFWDFRDASLGNLLASIDEGTRVNDLEFSPDDKYLAFAGNDNLLKILSINTLKPVHVLGKSD